MDTVTWHYHHRDTTACTYLDIITLSPPLLWQETNALKPYEKKSRSSACNKAVTTAITSISTSYCPDKCCLRGPKK
jgi:hypothetical protein